MWNNRNNKYFILLVLAYSILVDGGKNTVKVSKKDCSALRAEFVIVMDASSSIQADNFVKGKEFLVNIVKDFTIGPDKSRIGMVTFADDANIVFGLDKYGNIKDVQNGIRSANFLEGVTALGAGMNLAGKGILSKARSGLPKIVLVVTDGKNNRWPSATVVAEKMKKEGVTFVVIGVGNDINDSELKSISSSGTYYKVDSYPDLSGIVDKLVSNICTVLVEVTVKTCETDGDIAILLDGNKASLTSQSELVARVMHRLEIGSKNQRVAVVIDGKGIVAPLNKFTNRNDYIKFIKGGKFNVTKITGLGLVESGRLLTMDRKTVPKIVVLIRTGKISQLKEDKLAALALRKQGINVVAIAMGSQFNGEYLKELTTSKSVIYLKDMKYEESVVNEISENICENLKMIYKECVGKKMDIILVLDCSASIGPTNWLKQLNFAARITRMFEIGQSVTRLSTVYFSSNAFMGFKFNKYKNKEDTIKAIKQLPYSAGATAIGSALQLANKELKENSRKDAIPVMILMTDGESNMGTDPEHEALKIRNSGVHIISIGVSKHISEKQLIRISSLNRIHKIKDFDGLDTFPVQFITKEACNVLVKKPVSTCNDFEDASRSEL